MSGALGTGLTFAQLATLLGIIFGGLIAIRVTFNFDLNKYLDSRKEGYKAKCKNACLHFEFISKGNEHVEVRSFFVSPPGTVSYICQRCGMVRLHLDEEDYQRQVDYYLKNLKDYHKRNKRFHKLLKKAGQV